MVRLVFVPSSDRTATDIRMLLRVIVHSLLSVASCHLLHLARSSDDANIPTSVLVRALSPIPFNQ